MTFEGGPLPWPEAKSYRHVLTSSQPSAARMLHDGQPARTYRVVCAEISHQTLTVTVGNEKSATLPFPKHESATVQLHCEHPHTIALEPFLLPSYRPVDVALDDCVARRALPNSALTVHQVLVDRTIAVHLDLFNKDGRRFDNFSTTVFSWVRDLNLLEFRSTPFNGITLARSAGQLCDMGSKVALFPPLLSFPSFFLRCANPMSKNREEEKKEKKG